MTALAWALGGGAAGLIAGSFLATLAIRWGRGEGVARGRSRCDGCGRQLGPLELVPLVSFAALGGRCRTCRAAIDLRHPLLELACALIGAAALALQPGLAGAAGALFGWGLAVLALLDLDHFWLPDRLTLPLGLAGLALGAPPFPERLIGAAAGFLPLAVLAALYGRLRGREGLGLGDAKLLAAIGAWLGWRPLPWVMLGGAALGLGWCGLRLARGRRVAADDALPLGTLLALAAWPAWLASGA